MSEVSVRSNMRIAGSLILDQDNTEFPSNPKPGTLVIKDQNLFAYLSIGGMMTWYPLFQNVSHSYIHTQALASLQWTVNHGLGSLYTWYQIRDSAGNIVSEENRTNVEPDSFVLNFSEAFTGTVIVVGTSDLNLGTINASLITLGSEVVIDTAGMTIGGQRVLTADMVGAEVTAQVAAAVGPAIADLIAPTVAAAISTEVGNRNSAIAVAFSGEATNRDQAITNAIAAEAVSRDSAIAAAVGDEAAARIAAMDSQTTTLNASINTVVSAEAAARNSAIAAEAAALSNQITSAVSAEATARDAAIAAAVATSGSVDVAAERDARIAADQAEVTARDTAIESAIAAEVSARGTAITAAISDLIAGAPSDGDTLAKLRNLISGLQTLTNSNDVNLDTVQEIVNAIKADEASLTSITAGKVNVSDVVNNLTSTSTTAPLSAAQGKALNDAITSLIATGTVLKANKLATARNITLTGDATGTFVFDGSADVNFAVTGVKAAKLTTARNITLGGDASGTVAFDGSADITLTATIAKAAKLTTARTIALTGDVVGSATFDGSANISITTTAQGDTVNALGNISGPTSINYAAGSYCSFTPTAAATLSLTGVPDATKAYGVILEITNGGSNVTWPGSITWVSGSAPTLKTSGVNLISLVTRNGGTSWLGTSS